MARPQKVGIDYFALDVKMDDEVEIIEAQYGLEGFAVLIKLFQKIYSEGYFYEWGDREQILFSSRVNVDRNLVTSIVNDCIKWEIFDSELYEKYKILTSRRVQNHYFTSTYKRVDVEAIEEYLLINVSDRSNISLTRVSDDRNPPATIVSDIQSTQSKVKESKVNKSIVYKREEEAEPEKTSPLPDKNKDEFKKIANLYQQVIGQANGLTADWINDSLEEYGFDWLNNAMIEADKRGKRSKKYIEAILSNWKTEGGMRLDSDKKENKPYTKGKPLKTRFHNFEGRSDKYSNDELEDKMEKKRQEARDRMKDIGSSIGIDIGGSLNGD